MEQSLNLKSVIVRKTVTYHDKEGRRREKKVVDSKETAIARSKQSLIKEKFQNWLWSDEDRCGRLTKIYNQRYNCWVPRSYDGSYLVFPGMSTDFELRSYQRDFVARVLATGRGLAAHCVGAGKTATYIASAMRLKQLGLCNKPMIAVPKPVSQQVLTEFYCMYPAAHILCVSKHDFEKTNRQALISRIAMNDYDAVIITHEQFESIPLSPERLSSQLMLEIHDITTAMSSEEKGSFSVKELSRLRKNLYAKLEKLSASHNKDSLLTFESTGIDMLFIDESHYFKNLFTITKLTNVAGVNSSSSQRAFDLFTKSKYIYEINNRRGMVHGSGTCVSNSITELYTIFRYLAPTELASMGLNTFDSWISTYGKIVSSLELKPEGTGYRMRDRIAEFSNLPELMILFHMIADVQTEEKLNLPRPEIENGTPHLIRVPPTTKQVAVMGTYVDRAESIRSGSVDAHEDNMLLITNQARRLAVDPRLVDEEEYEETKIHYCSSIVYDNWVDSKDPRSVQVIFSDIGTPKEGFNVYDEIKNQLVKRGIPTDKIAFIHDATTDSKREKLFALVRKGEIQILIGSTEKLGTGVNIQDRIFKIYNLDVPFRPSDFDQRIGRGQRYGNLNKYLGIYYFITEGTFDAYMWQIQQQKRLFTSQLLSGKAIARSCMNCNCSWCSQGYCLW